MFLSNGYWLYVVSRKHFHEDFMHVFLCHPCHQNEIIMKQYLTHHLDFGVNIQQSLLNLTMALKMLLRCTPNRLIYHLTSPSPAKTCSSFPECTCTQTKTHTHTHSLEKQSIALQHITSIPFFSLHPMQTKLCVVEHVITAVVYFHFGILVIAS